MSEEIARILVNSPPPVQTSSVTSADIALGVPYGFPNCSTSQQPTQTTGGLPGFGPWRRSPFGPWVRDPLCRVCDSDDTKCSRKAIAHITQTDGSVARWRNAVDCFGKEMAYGTPICRYAVNRLRRYQYRDHTARVPIRFTLQIIAGIPADVTVIIRACRRGGPVETTEIGPMVRANDVFRFRIPGEMKGLLADLVFARGSDLIATYDDRVLLDTDNHAMLINVTIHPEKIRYIEGYEKFDCSPPPAMPQGYGMGYPNMYGGPMYFPGAGMMPFNQTSMGLGGGPPVGGAGAYGNFGMLQNQLLNQSQQMFLQSQMRPEMLPPPLNDTARELPSSLALPTAGSTTTTQEGSAPPTRDGIGMLPTRMGWDNPFSKNQDADNVTDDVTMSSEEKSSPSVDTATNPEDYMPEKGKLSVGDMTTPRVPDALAAPKF